MHSNVNPTAAPPPDGSMGSRPLHRLFRGRGYEFLGDGTHIVTVQGNFTHEIQTLKGTTNADATGPAGNKSARSPASVLGSEHLWRDGGWQRNRGRRTGSVSAGELTGSNNSKPNSNEFIIEADWVPFGKDSSWANPLST